MSGTPSSSLSLSNSFSPFASVDDALPERSDMHAAALGVSQRSRGSPTLEMQLGPKVVNASNEPSAYPSPSRKGRPSDGGRADSPADNTHASSSSGSPPASSSVHSRQPASLNSGALHMLSGSHIAPRPSNAGKSSIGLSSDDSCSETSVPGIPSHDKQAMSINSSNTNNLSLSSLGSYVSPPPSPNSLGSSSVSGSFSAAVSGVFPDAVSDFPSTQTYTAPAKLRTNQSSRPALSDSPPPSPVAGEKTVPSSPNVSMGVQDERILSRNERKQQRRDENPNEQEKEGKYDRGQKLFTEKDFQTGLLFRRRRGQFPDLDHRLDGIVNAKVKTGQKSQEFNYLSLLFDLLSQHSPNKLSAQQIRELANGKSPAAPDFGTVRTTSDSFLITVVFKANCDLCSWLPLLKAAGLVFEPKHKPSAEEHQTRYVVEDFKWTFPHGDVNGRDAEIVAAEEACTTLANELSSVLGRTPKVSRLFVSISGGANSPFDAAKRPRPQAEIFLTRSEAPEVAFFLENWPSKDMFGNPTRHGARTPPRLSKTAPAPADDSNCCARCLGHHAPGCSNKPRCIKCSQEGHLISVCRNSAFCLFCDKSGDPSDHRPTKCPREGGVKYRKGWINAKNKPKAFSSASLSANLPNSDRPLMPILGGDGERKVNERELVPASHVSYAAVAASRSSNSEGSNMMLSMLQQLMVTVNNDLPLKMQSSLDVAVQSIRADLKGDIGNLKGDIGSLNDRMAALEFKQQQQQMFGYHQPPLLPPPTQHYFSQPHQPPFPPFQPLVSLAQPMPSQQLLAFTPVSTQFLPPAVSHLSEQSAHRPPSGGVNLINELNHAASTSANSSATSDQQFMSVPPAAPNQPPSPIEQLAARVKEQQLVNKRKSDVVDAGTVSYESPKDPSSDSPTKDRQSVRGKQRIGDRDHVHRPRDLNYDSPIPKPRAKSSSPVRGSARGPAKSVASSNDMDTSNPGKSQIIPHASPTSSISITTLALASSPALSDLRLAPGPPPAPTPPLAAILAANQRALQSAASNPALPPTSIGLAPKPDRDRPAPSPSATAPAPSAAQKQILKPPPTTKITWPASHKPAPAKPNASSSARNGRTPITNAPSSTSSSAGQDIRSHVSSADDEQFPPLSQPSAKQPDPKNTTKPNAVPTGTHITRSSTSKQSASVVSPPASQVGRQ